MPIENIQEEFLEYIQICYADDKENKRLSIAHIQFTYKKLLRRDILCHMKIKISDLIRTLTKNSYYSLLFVTAENRIRTQDQESSERTFYSFLYFT
jgi:hypothetical protein